MRLERPGNLVLQEDRKKSEPRVLRVSTAIYQHPPTISCGKAKMESEKQWEMDGEPKDERNQSKNQKDVVKRKTKKKKGRLERR